jgi:hypothetical protein
MRGWLKLRTVTVDAWIDMPRLGLPDDEVKGMSEWLKSLFRRETRASRINVEVDRTRSIPYRAYAQQSFEGYVTNAINDRLSLALGLTREEFSNSIRDPAFVSGTFKKYELLVEFLSGGLMANQLIEKNKRNKSPGPEEQYRQFDQIRALVDQLERWEKEYESPRRF